MYTMNIIDIFHLFIAVALYCIIVLTGFFLIGALETWIKNKFKN